MNDEVHDTCRQAIKYLVGRTQNDPALAGHMFGVDTLARLCRTYEALGGAPPIVANRPLPYVPASAAEYQDNIKRVIAKERAEQARLRRLLEGRIEEVNSSTIELGRLETETQAERERSRWLAEELGERTVEAVTRAEQAEAAAANSEKELAKAKEREDGLWAVLQDVANALTCKGKRIEEQWDDAMRLLSPYVSGDMRREEPVPAG